MTNKEIAAKFNLLGKLLELHGENKFKIRSYGNAYLKLRKLNQPLSEMSDAEISALPGIGKAIFGKIKELLKSGEMATLIRYIDQTPPGIVELLGVKGLGVKKLSVIWKELGLESAGEVLYAIQENRLLDLKGFGAKTQEDLRKTLEYFLQSRGKYHFATLEREAQSTLKAIHDRYPDVEISLVGKMRRHCNIVEKIEILVAQSDIDVDGILTGISKSGEKIEGRSVFDLPVCIYSCMPAEFGSKQFRYTASEHFMEAFLGKFPNESFKDLADENRIFEKVKMPYLVPALREEPWSLDLDAKLLDDLVQEDKIKGVLHAHTTYSDGVNTLKEMAEYCQAQGFEWLGITDHSQSAFYANGLKPERVWQQMEEIDLLNQSMSAFKIFKGIESDILNDGSLDYEADLLKAFDFIIASVHSQLKMDKNKATERIVKAVENPYTTMLGHPSGRLLLSRKAYPLDYPKIIDACAANGVAIELNANPYRLDLDWRWIPYAMEKGVRLAVNPDAHSLDGVHDIHFGVLSAQKGAMTNAVCVNTLSADDFSDFLGEK